MTQKVTHSAATEPPEYPYCEACANFEDECECEVGYQEERDEY
jgi:recombinational DNA repair protein RecR